MSLTVTAALSQAQRAAPGVDAHDALRLLADCVDKSLAWLRQHADHALSATESDTYAAWLARAQSGEPIPYISGIAGFWTLDLRVTPDVLIPRADTETLVSLALEHGAELAQAHILDLGTGSGAIALALKSERPGWQVTATDASLAALSVARDNAQRLDIPVDFHQGNWYAAIPATPPHRFDIIVSNPPYVASDDPDLDEAVRRFEPDSALFSADQGLADIQTICCGARQHLQPGGWLAVEHGHRQAAAVQAIFAAENFEQVATAQDLAGRDRVTHGRLPA